VIGLLIGFIALIVFGGLIWDVSRSVVGDISTVVQGEFPSAFSGGDAKYLTFMSQYWVWLGLIMVLGGIYHLVVEAQRRREAARYG